MAYQLQAKLNDRQPIGARKAVALMNEGPSRCAYLASIPRIGCAVAS
jgi:hypothetical protein